MAQFEVKFGPNRAKWVEQSIYAIPDAISANILIKNGQNPTNSIFSRKLCLINYINRGSAALGAALLIRPDLMAGCGQHLDPCPPNYPDSGVSTMVATRAI